MELMIVFLVQMFLISIVIWLMVKYINKVKRMENYIETLEKEIKSHKADVYVIKNKGDAKYFLEEVFKS